MSADTIAEALKARVTSVAQAPAYDADELKALGAALPSTYVEFYLQRRSVDNASRIGSGSDPTGWRLSLRAVARTVTNRRLLEDRFMTAFGPLNPVTLDGQPVEIRWEQGGGDGGTQPDETGYYSALTDFIFVR